MRLRWFLIPLIVATVSPAAAQRPSTPPPDSARGVLLPVQQPFSIELPGAPGLTTPWLRPRTENWAAQWERSTRTQVDEQLALAWRAALERPEWEAVASALAADAAAAAAEEAAARGEVAPDTVAYLPLRAQRDTVRPSALPGMAGELAELGMMITGRGDMGGSWQRMRPCDMTFGYGACNPSRIPQLKPQVEFGVRVGGTVSDRVHVNVDYDQRREFDAANNINVFYQGLEDEILQRLEVGDVSIRLPSSRFVTQGVPAGNFGFKAIGELGPLDFQAVWAQQKGDITTRQFQGGGGRGAGLVQDARLVLDDADYAKGQFFFVVDPHRLRGAPHVDILRLQPADGPTEVRPAPGVAIQLFRQESHAFGGSQMGQPGYFQANATAVSASGADTTRHSGIFKLLTPNEDYQVHPSRLWLMLRQPLGQNEALAIAYVTETGDTVGTLDAERAIDGTPTLRLLRGPATGSLHQPGQPTWPHEVRQVYRLDSSNGVERSSVDLRISLGELSGGITYRNLPAAAGTISFLQLFGLDEDAPREQIDGARIYQPAIGAFGEANPDARIGGTYIVFPTLRPFALPPAVPSAGLSAEDTRQILAQDSNAVIYEHVDPVTRSGGGRFRLTFQYKVRSDGIQSSFNLGAFGIREGSERIFVDDRQLQVGTDYTIDYDMGQVTLNDALAIFGRNPDASIRATFEQKPIFQLAPTSVFGASARYGLGQVGELNFMGLYQAEKSLMSRPHLGMEPGAIFLGGVGGHLQLGARWLDRALDRVPLLRIGGESAVNLTGEMALSLPNPNTRGDTYLDDFDGGDELHVGLNTRSWRLGSRPGSLAGAMDVLPDVPDVPNAARLVWQSQWAYEDGSPGLRLAPEAIDQHIQMTHSVMEEPALWLSWGAAAAPPGERHWRSLTTVLETNGRDMSRSEFLEFYVWGGEGQGRDMALIFDIGTVGEDAFYFDAEGNTSGVYPDGRRWGLGVLDEEASVVEREIWTHELDDRGLWNQACRASRNQLMYEIGDERANCARGNGFQDTEDLNGNGVLDEHDGALFRYVVRLDRLSPYLVRDQAATGTNFRLYRIPLRGPEALSLGGDESTWRFIRHMRMTVTGMTRGEREHLVLARMRFVGSRWTKREVHGVLQGETSALEGAGRASTLFQVGPVSRLTDGMDYTPPPGVVDRLQDPTQGFGGQGVEFNEKALRLRYEMLEPGERGEVFFRYPQQGRSLLTYRELRLWAVARNGRFDEHGDQRLLVKVGTDAQNHYLYRAPVPVAAPSGVRASDWAELRIDFEEWFELKARAEQQLIAQGAPAGEPLVLWSEDGRYGIVLEDRARAPNLASVREISFAVHNGGGFPEDGEVWINELRLGRAMTDPGFAGTLNLSVQAGDFLSTNVAFSNQGALFRQLHQESSYQTSGDLTISSTAQVGQFLPSGWGLDLPVSVSHSRTGLEPTFLANSDVRADRLEGLRRTGSSRTRVGITARKRTPTANPWLGLLLDGSALTLGYTTAASDDVASSARSGSMDGSVTYGRQLAPRELDVTPGWVQAALRAVTPRPLRESDAFQRLETAQLRWSPQRLNFNTRYFSQEAESFRYDRILRTPADDTIPAVRSIRTGLDQNAQLSLVPFKSLTGDLNLATVRDLVPPEQATTRPLERQAIAGAVRSLGGLDVGWETSRSMSSQVGWRPEVASWLRPAVSFSSRFRTDRSPSLVAPLLEGSDTVGAVLQRNFQTDRQISRTLSIQPDGLTRALVGQQAEPGGLARAVRRAGGALLPLEMSWTSGQNSAFDRETVAPGLAYQLGLGDFDSFRVIGGDTAISAAVRSGFRAGTGLRLPWETQLRMAYNATDTESQDMSGGVRTSAVRTFPDLQFSWAELPLPGFVAPVLRRVSVNTGIQRNRRESITEGMGGREQTSRDMSFPLGVRLGLAGGFSFAYTGTISGGEQEHPTGFAEQAQAQHSVQLSGSFQPPESMRGRITQSINTSLRFNVSSQTQCARTFSAESSLCARNIDSNNKSFHLSFDTVLADTNVGLQMGYTDRNSFVGVQQGSSQFQLSLFGQFNFTAGNFAAPVPGGYR
jgi:hypothetical protein